MICPICKKGFQTDSKQKVYCSGKCQRLGSLEGKERDLKRRLDTLAKRMDAINDAPEKLYKLCQTMDTLERYSRELIRSYADYIGIKEGVGNPQDINISLTNKG